MAYTKLSSEDEARLIEDAEWARDHGSSEPIDADVQPDRAGTVLSIHMDPRRISALSKLAKKQGRSMDDVLSCALDEYIASQGRPAAT